MLAFVLILDYKNFPKIMSGQATAIQRDTARKIEESGNYIDGLMNQFHTDKHFNESHLETAVAFALGEDPHPSTLEVGGHPIRRLCTFFLSLQNDEFATYKFAKALMDHDNQQLLRSALSEIELISDDFITIVCFGKTQPKSLMTVNAENQLVQFGKITTEEIDALRTHFHSERWNDRIDRNAMPCNVTGTLHRISRISGGFIMRLGSLRDRKQEVVIYTPIVIDHDSSSSSSSSTQTLKTETNLYDYQNFRDKIHQIIQLLALNQSVLLVSAPGKGKTSLLRELLRGIAKYVKLNENIDERVVLVDKNHEIVGTGKFGRDLGKYSKRRSSSCNYR